MEVNRKLEADTLTITLSGRLDTVSAPAFEEQIKDLTGVKTLVLDLKDLSYISSAGLRVLLTAQKRMNQQGSMVLRNVCPSVRDVLDITGFSGILTIEG